MSRGRLGWLVAALLLIAMLSPPTHAQLRGVPVSCVVPVSVATTITAVGGDCAARLGFTLWITDIQFSSSAAGLAADAFPTLKYGTGTTCGTGTTVFWGALTTGVIAFAQSFATPIRLPANVDVCWINSTAGSKFLVLTGYYTP